MKPNDMYYTCEVNVSLRTGIRTVDIFSKSIEYPIIPRVGDTLDIGIEDLAQEVTEVVLNRFQSKVDAEVYVDLEIDSDDEEEYVEFLTKNRFVPQGVHVN